MTKVVTIGGGTGQFHVLRALTRIKESQNLEITAIPTITDSGGSSGKIRTDLGIIAPGDVGQCVYALHPKPEQVAWLFEHRFGGNSDFSGHSVRNIIVTAALEAKKGSQEAFDILRDTFGLLGNITPATLDDAHVQAKLADGSTLSSEDEIYRADVLTAGGVEGIWLSPQAKANDAALKAITEADFIVVCPGTTLSSIVPNFLVERMREALVESKAHKVCIANLMNRKGHVDPEWTVRDHIEYLETFLKTGFFETVIANSAIPSEEQIETYREESILMPSVVDISGRNVIAMPLTSAPIKTNDNDALASLRASVRHDSEKLASALAKVL